MKARRSGDGLRFTACVCLLGLLPSLAQAASKAAPKLDVDTINNASWDKAAVRSRQISPQIIKAQVMLARARYSPGEIDGRDGEGGPRDAVRADALRCYEPSERPGGSWRTALLQPTLEVMDVDAACGEARR